MVDRLSARRVTGIVAAAFLAACIQVAGPGRSGTADEELATQARALQRTVLEAAATGAVAGASGGYVFGG